MLVLSRKMSETIVINGEITIQVLRIRGGSIRIGIQAPNEVRVRRGELAETPATHPHQRLVADGLASPPTAASA